MQTAALSNVGEGVSTIRHCHNSIAHIGSKAGGVLDPRGVFVGSLDGSEPPRLLVAGAAQAQYANGHVLFVQNGTLMAQPFDAKSLTLGGTPFPLVEDVKLPTAGATGATAAFSVSADGAVLAYQSAVRLESRPVLFNRIGRQVAALAPAGDYGEVALSPDGRRFATSVTECGLLDAREILLQPSPDTGVDAPTGQDVT